MIVLGESWTMAPTPDAQIGIWLPSACSRIFASNDTIQTSHFRDLRQLLGERIRRHQSRGHQSGRKSIKGLVHRIYTMFTSFRAKSGMAQWIHHVSICASLGCDYDHSKFFLVPTPPFSLCFSSLFVFSRWQLVTVTNCDRDCHQLSPTVTPNKIRWWHFFS